MLKEPSSPDADRAIDVKEMLRFRPSCRDPTPLTEPSSADGNRKIDGVLLLRWRVHCGASSKLERVDVFANSSVL